MIQSDDLDQTLFILLADTHNNQSSVPDEKVATGCSCNSNLSAGQEDCLGIAASLSIRRCKILLVSRWRVVVELVQAWRPIQEKHSLNTVAAKFVRVVGVEFDPVLILEDVGVLEFKTANWAILLLVGPIPKRNSLRSVCSQRSDILVIR